MKVSLQPIGALNRHSETKLIKFVNCFEKFCCEIHHTMVFCLSFFLNFIGCFKLTLQFDWLFCFTVLFLLTAKKIRFRIKKVRFVNKSQIASITNNFKMDLIKDLQYS